MASFVAINDIGILVNNKTRFKTCRVTFRNKTQVEIESSLKLSQLKNINLSVQKGQVLCFCDGLIDAPLILPQKEIEIIDEVVEFERKPVQLEDEHKDLNPVEYEEIQEERALIYEKEKIQWISRFSKSELLKTAIRQGYSCDEAYARERVQAEFPGFSLVDEHTMYWQSPLPSLENMKIEERIMKQINGAKAKLGTYTRNVIIEEHNGIVYDDTPGIVIFNYLWRYEVIAVIDDIKDQEYCRG